MRYVEFMESKGGREIANNALDRSTLIFLKVFSSYIYINNFFFSSISSTLILFVNIVLILPIGFRIN